jgi:hypothetical protein
MKDDVKWRMAKDKVAQKYGFKDWASWYIRRSLPFPESIYYEVAQEYNLLCK